MPLRKNVDTLLKKFEKQYTTHNHIEVSQSAILHNIDVFETLSGKQVIPVLKGNAYGHGTILVAKALRKRKLPYVAVDGYFEALRIREVSKQPVLVMGAILPENFARMKYDNFAFVVQDEATIHTLGKTKKSIKVHLECNTGMNRYGVKPDEIIHLTKLILSYKNLDLEGIMSHLADSDGDNPATVNSAVAIFDTCVDAVRAVGASPSIIHVAQSAGSLKAHSKYANTIRVGIGAYGINPFPKHHPLNRQLQKDLRPALKLVSTVTKIIELEKGDEVSYNYTFTAPKRMKIAVIPLGYYEGVNRALSNCGVVKIGETFVPIIGRVCMNHTMLSLENADTKVGDRVVIYSNNPADLNAIDMVASKHNLFNYNLLTILSPDVRRTLVV
jgi:alanine racemase